jgi:transposase
MKIELGREQRRELETLLTSPDTHVAHARRVRVVLLSADGVSGVEIAQLLSLSSGQVSRIRGRFRKGGVAALSERPRPGRHDHAASAEQIALVLSLRASPAPAAEKTWSTRRIAAKVGLTSATVAKLLREHGGCAALAQRE